MTEPVVFLCQAFHDCPVGNTLTTQIFNYLKENGITVTQHSPQASMIIINACSIFEESETQSMHAVDFYTKKYPEKKIILTGCFLKKNLKERKNLITIPYNRINELDSIFKSKKAIADVSANILNPGISGKNYRSGYFNILISRGCSCNCTYCAEKLMHPEIRSRPAKLILNEFRSGLKQGHKEFLLISDDAGSYGLDKGTNIVELLGKMFSIKGDFRVSIEAFEPRGLIRFIDDLKSILKTGRVRMINLPVQSGSDRILGLMNRMYTVRQARELVKKIRKLSPETELFTDIIYSFPGEKRKEFMDSIGISRLFDYTTFNSFSFRKGTSASTVELKIPVDELEFRKKYISKIKNETVNRMDQD